ncbi:unnamed protein product, partial [Prorocentrum cordatum]
MMLLASGGVLVFSMFSDGCHCSCRVVAEYLGPFADQTTTCYLVNQTFGGVEGALVLTFLLGTVFGSACSCCWCACLAGESWQAGVLLRCGADECETEIGMRPTANQVLANQAWYASAPDLDVYPHLLRCPPLSGIVLTDNSGLPLRESRSGTQWTVRSVVCGDQWGPATLELAEALSFVGAPTPNPASGTAPAVPAPTRRLRCKQEAQALQGKRKVKEERPLARPDSGSGGAGGDSRVGLQKKAQQQAEKGDEGDKTRAADGLVSTDLSRSVAFALELAGVGTSSSGHVVHFPTLQKLRPELEVEMDSVEPTIAARVASVAAVGADCATCAAICADSAADVEQRRLNCKGVVGPAALQQFAGLVMDASDKDSCTRGELPRAIGRFTWAVVAGRGLLSIAQSRCAFCHRSGSRRRRLRSRARQELHWASSVAFFAGARAAADQRVLAIGASCAGDNNDFGGFGAVERGGPPALAESASGRSEKWRFAVLEAIAARQLALGSDAPATAAERRCLRRGRSPFQPAPSEPIANEQDWQRFVRGRLNRPDGIMALERSAAQPRRSACCSESGAAGGEWAVPREELHAVCRANQLSLTSAGSAGAAASRYLDGLFLGGCNRDEGGEAIAAARHFSPVLPLGDSRSMPRTCAAARGFRQPAPGRTRQPAAAQGVRSKTGDFDEGAPLSSAMSRAAGESLGRLRATRAPAERPWTFDGGQFQRAFEQVFLSLGLPGARPCGRYARYFAELAKAPQPLAGRGEMIERRLADLPIGRWTAPLPPGIASGSRATPARRLSCVTALDLEYGEPGPIPHCR